MSLNSLTREKYDTKEQGCEACLILDASIEAQLFQPYPHRTKDFTSRVCLLGFGERALVGRCLACHACKISVN